MIPILSLVICTHRRFELLELVVQSLCEQNANKEDFEVIVVDNDSISNTEVRTCVEKANSKIQISYIHESNLGLSIARNTGGKAAKSDYVGYMDDDAKAPWHYIQTAIEIISTSKPLILGGSYYAFYLSPKPKWFSEKYESDFKGDQIRFLESNEFLNGTNMIYRRELLDKVAWFDVHFGMIGKRIAYAEETNLQMNLRKQNPELQIYYHPDLYVYHLVPAHKMKLSDRLKRMYYMGKSQHDLFENKKVTTSSVFKFYIKLICIEPLKMLFRDREKYPYYQNYIYEVIARYFSHIGQQSAK